MCPIHFQKLYLPLVATIVTSENAECEDNWANTVGPGLLF